MSESFKNKELEKLNKKVSNSKSSADKTSTFEYAKTVPVASETTKVYSSEINKKNAKKRKTLIILLILLFLILLVGIGLILYFTVLKNDGTKGPSDARFKIDIYSELKDEEGTSTFLFNCMPGDYFDSPLTITNNSTDTNSDVLIRFKFYVVCGNDNFIDCIDAVFVNKDKWIVDEETGYNYYIGKISSLSTVSAYEEFGIKKETSNALNGAQAKLILVVDILEANMQAGYAYWPNAPVNWQLKINEIIG